MISPLEILSIFVHNSDFTNCSESIRKQQSAALCKAFARLDYYFLMEPDIITPDFKPHIYNIFHNPPDNEVMELCTKCIISALKSDMTTVIHPLEFPYLSIITKVKKSQFSDCVIINLLEIIFTIFNKREDYLQKVDFSDIDYFCKYFFMLQQPSRINCLKCINSIILLGISEIYFKNLPNLLDFALSPENDDRIYELTTNILITLLKFYNKTRAVDYDLTFDFKKFIEKLCYYTFNYKSKENLNVLIDALNLCISIQPISRKFILDQINLANFIYFHPEKEVFISTLNLIYELIPLPREEQNGLIDYKNHIGLSQSLSDPLFIKSKSQIQNIFPYICDFFASNIEITKDCLEMICTLSFNNVFEVKFPNKLLYMLHFLLNDKYSYFELISTIIFEGLKFNENIQPILRSGIIDHILNKGRHIGLRNFVESMPKTIFPSDTELFDFSSVKDLAQMIDQNPLFQLDFFSFYFKKIATNTQTIESRKIYALFNDYENLDTIEVESQKIVDFLLQFLADIPIPCYIKDDFYPQYDKLFNEETLQLDDIQYSMNSILHEKFITSEDCNIFRIHELVNKNQELRTIIDKSMLNNELDRYALSVLYRELDDQIKRQLILDEHIPVNDTDQFVLTILPQLYYNCGVFRKENDLKKRRFRHKFRYYENDQKPNKRNNMYSILSDLLGDDIVQNILKILDFIHYKDKNHLINFISEPFLGNILYQMQYLYLNLGMHSPCSRIMVNYPYLFDPNDRLFLFKLLIKEPLMAKDFYMKKYEPSYNVEKRNHYSVLKFVVNRENIFKEGIIILKRFAKYRSAFEIKFNGEKGYGPGPTKEFFHLMSREFCKKRHRLWRRDNFSTDESNNDYKRLYAHNKQGLFPYATANSRYMYYLGLFVAKAIQMEEVIDIPFNPAFFDLANNIEIDLKDVDETLYNSLNDPSAEEALIDFPFTAIVEGRSFDLVKNGDNIFVNHNNFQAYKKEMEKFVCGRHVKKVIDFFVDGFAEVLDPTLLKMFSGKEMIEVINGQRELFSVEELSKFIVCGNGYDMKSPQIQNLIEVVASFDMNLQKLFLQFVTGSPFLPIGGMEALDPPISIVRKYSQNSRIRDDFYLPSSQTCINTFYLPPYPTKEIMREKIIKVITECVESFDLF